MSIVPSGLPGSPAGARPGDQGCHVQAHRHGHEHSPAPQLRHGLRHAPIARQPAVLPHHDGILPLVVMLPQSRSEALVRAAIEAGQRDPVMGGGGGNDLPELPHDSDPGVAVPLQLPPPLPNELAGEWAIPDLLHQPTEDGGDGAAGEGIGGSSSADDSDDFDLPLVNSLWIPAVQVAAGGSATAAARQRRHRPKLRMGGFVVAMVAVPSAIALAMALVLR